MQQLEAEGRVEESYGANSDETPSGEPERRMEEGATLPMRKNREDLRADLAGRK